MTIYFHDMFFTEQKGEGTDFLCLSVHLKKRHIYLCAILSNFMKICTITTRKLLFLEM